LLRDGMTPANNVRTEQLARRALLRDATNVSAAATLGFVVQLRDPVRAEQLFRYAEGLSRRELRTQIWMIENAVVKGQVQEALRHYDVALRSSSSAPALLYPALAVAIADPFIRRSLIEVLRRRPAWSESFLRGVSINGPDFAAAAALLTELRAGGIAPPAEAIANLSASLAARGDYGRAWRLFADGTPGVSRLRIRNGSFTTGDFTASPFNWLVGNDGGFSAAIQGEPEGVLNVEASPTVGGVAVKQLQLLPPGRYRLSTRVRNVAQPAESRPYWTIACASGRELSRVQIGQAGEKGAIFADEFIVPSDCAAQWLSLTIVPSDLPEGVSMLVDDVEIQQVRT
jgi:hypothetical protein